ncbi:hypothetical protein AGMMS50249_3180 [candidate division SR1 bacterium]|nr:hypothetical protein AGMMS50249_3180 [candidate division SR1 bacterium]
MGNKATNRLVNTGGIVHRPIASTVNTGYNIVKSTLNYPKEILETLLGTGKHMQNVFKSVKKGKTRYRKFGRALASPFVAIGTGVEVVGRAITTPSIRLFSHLRDSLGNGIHNIGSAINMIGKTDNSYSYKLLKIRNHPLQKNNTIAAKFHGEGANLGISSAQLNSLTHTKQEKKAEYDSEDISKLK